MNIKTSRPKYKRQKETTQQQQNIPARNRCRKSLQNDPWSSNPVMSKQPAWCDWEVSPMSKQEQSKNKKIQPKNAHCPTVFSPSCFSFPPLSFSNSQKQKQRQEIRRQQVYTHIIYIYMSTKNHTPGTAHPLMLVGSWEHDGKRVWFPPSGPKVWALQCRAQIWMSQAVEVLWSGAQKFARKINSMKEGHDQFPTGVSLEDWTGEFSMGRRYIQSLACGLLCTVCFRDLSVAY